ncbi:hypothetical protein CcCBS67573_g01889 [Chytriomyces confervae]|uniref:Uncharacterized protein n=1 Tax=Chytriomyces confervae TaxID=246404 RepID=A0A507FKN7_9FUNG|nr:hypothetical protein HDU80_011268 [Chytriomyces hyalinus]TPX76833.1 hypothetical protein CcCBS67573_g01889 [Chytriomyces confervae]
MVKNGKKYKQPAPFAKPNPTDNQPPPKSATNDGYDLANEPVPKAFKRVMLKNAKVLKRQQEPRKPKPTSKLQVKPGESLRAFNRRVDDEIRISVNAAAKAETATAIKRKRRLLERKMKRNDKRKGSADSDDEKDFPQKEVVPFGAQANEPPKISVIPKKVGGGAGAMRAMAAALEAKEKKEKEEANRARFEKDIPAVGRKTKFKDLPLVRQKNIMEERQKVIEQYRLSKKTKDQ